jgi:hypothetical protein
MNFYPKILMVVCLLRLLSWSSPALAQTLPCLDSSKECVEELTQSAIAHSSKLKTLDDRIALIDKRLGVSRDSIDYANNKLQLLGVEERGDHLNDQLVEARTKQDEAVRELVQVTGGEAK